MNDVADNIREWNSLPVNIRELNSLKTFTDVIASGDNISNTKKTSANPFFF